LLGLCSVGCVNARAPDIYINSGPPPEDVDSSQVPETATHEEARAELVKAYNQIRYLEYRNERLTRKAADLREERDEAKRKYEQLKDKYED